jgi:hypothetical protein
MFRIELLPAAHGDSIWVEYGDPAKPRRILIDGGPAPTYEPGLFKRLQTLKKGERIDLFVVTHIDSDHIDGAVILLQQAKELRVKFDEVWFNGWRHIKDAETDSLQPLQGEFLGALLEREVRDEWNASAKTRSKAIAVPDSAPLPVWDLPDDARLTLLSPGPPQIKRLRARWSSAMRDFAGDSAEALRRLKERREYRPPVPPPVFGGEKTYGSDRSPANGSSIAFLLEHDGVAALFGADAYARVLADSLRRLSEARNPGRGLPIRLDAFKLPHHGSLANVNEELVAAIECPKYLVSTNGAVFGHPDKETAELIARHAPGAEFFCNYKSDTTRAFADAGANPRWLTRYPGEGVPAGAFGGFVLDLAPRKGRPRVKKATGAARPRKPARRGPA